MMSKSAHPSPLGRLLALTAALLSATVLLSLAPSATAQNTTLAVKCTSTADCLGPRGSTFCDPVVGVCALTTCGVNANTGLACSLFNSSTFCTSLTGGGLCAPRLPLDSPCNPVLEVGSGSPSLPPIPGFNSNSSSVEQTNSQCMPGLKCDTTQNNVCKTDGPLGWARYMWEAKRGTIIAIGVGILALLVCCCCWGCWMCGCAAVSTACMACSCLKSCCSCCCPSGGKSSGGSGGGGGGGGYASSKQPAYAEPPAPVHVPAAPAPAASYSTSHSNNTGGGSHGGNITYHEASYSNASAVGSPSARPANSSGYAGKIVNIETEQIVMAPVSKPSPPPAPMPVPAPASYHSVPQQPMYAQPIMQQQPQPPQPQYGGGGGYVAPQPSGGSGSHMYASGNVGGYGAPQPSPGGLYAAAPAPGVPMQHSGSNVGYYQPEMQVAKEQMMYGGSGGGYNSQPPPAGQQYAASTGGYAQHPAVPTGTGYYPQGQQPQPQQQQQGYGYGGGNAYGR